MYVFSLRKKNEAPQGIYFILVCVLAAFHILIVNAHTLYLYVNVHNLFLLILELQQIYISFFAAFITISHPLSMYETFDRIASHRKVSTKM